MKYIKRIVIGFFIFFLLAGAAIFILLTFYKKEMARMLTDSLKTNYGLNLDVKDVNVSFFDNWPQASVQLKDIYLSNDTSKKDPPLLKAGSLSLSFDLEKLLQKQFIVQSVSLEDAELNMIRNADGSRNFEFRSQAKKEGPASSSSISFEIEKVAIHHTAFQFANRETGLHIAIDFVNTALSLKHYSDGIDLRLRGQLLVHELLFKPHKGPFLKNTRASVDFDMDYFKNDKTVCIHPPSTIEIEKQRYNVATLLKLGEEKKLALYLASNNIWYEKVARLLTPKIQKVLSNFEIKKPFNANVLIVTNPGKREEPILIVNVSGQNSDLTIGNTKIPYSNVLFNGKIISMDSTRTHGSGEEARVIFKPVIGKIYDFPFTASVYVTDLTNPYIHIEGSLYIDAAKINSKINKEFILKGSCSVKLNYSGFTQYLNQNDYLGRNMQLKADLFFNDLSYMEMTRPFKYTVKGKASMNNRDLRFDHLLLKTNGGDVTLKGGAEGFVNFVMGNSNTLKATIAAKTESLNLNPFIEASEATDPIAEAGPAKKTAPAEDSHFEFNISLAAKKLRVKHVDAGNANISVFYRTNYLNIRSASMNACDGRLLAKGTMENFNKINTEISVQDVNVNKLFDQFDNFGQKVILSENLKGTLSLDATFKTQLTDNMHINVETMSSEVKLKLKDGHLINFEPVQNMSNFLFRNRDFNDVRFSELNEAFKVRGYEMKIEELEIASNILNLFVVNGVYNFRGNSMLNLLIPWNNLKRRGKNYVPQNSGQSAENTKGLKLHVSGPNNKMKIGLGHRSLPEN